MLNVKPPKKKKKLEYDDKKTREQIVASSAVAENKTIDFDDFNSPNSSIMAAGLSSPEFGNEFKRINEMNFLMTLILVQAQISIQITIHV